MAGRARLICASSALPEGGDGVRFEVELTGTRVSAFAIRFDGVAHAYLNRCAHVGVELDWQPGKFFDSEGLLLICSSHGALYDPATGACLGGPCSGGGLEKLAIEERDGEVLVIEG
jgi:nitrite reductase/ring-hydroxylating ferredoxin subunit